MASPSESDALPASALFPDAPERLLDAALSFVADCLAGGALRGHAERFAPTRARTDAPLREAFAEGLAVFATDLGRWGYAPETPEALFAHLRVSPNLQVPFFHRVTHALHLRGAPELPDVLAMLARQQTGMEIYYSAVIGPAMKVIHGLGTVIGAWSRVGSHFTVYQNVTIGDKLGAQTGRDARPVLADHVILSAGAKVLGPVTIGAKTIVAANAVVLHSLPERCIAAGAPAKVKRSGVSDAEFDVYWQSFRG